MTRLYIQPSFLNSCEEHGLWSGGNDQYRGDRSVDLATFDKNGRARVEAFSDSAIESLKKKNSVPLKQRILPQSARVDKLRSEAIELEAAFKAGEFSAEEYTLLREVAFKKLRRAEELLKKAIAPVQKEEETLEDEEEISYASSYPSSDNNSYRESYSSPIGGIATSVARFFAEVVDGLSSENSFKKILQKGCKGVRMLVRLSQQAAAYYRTLKEV